MVSFETERKRNFNIFSLSTSMMSFALGLFGPFYLIFINKIGGGIENFGIAVGLVVLSGALTSFVAGKYSDKFGRKPFLIVGGYASALVVFLYTIVGSLWQLYLLQVFNGLIKTVFETSEIAFLGDSTNKSSRGKDVGKYHALLGMAEAAAIFIGGFLIGALGFSVVFYFVAIIFSFSTTILFGINERL